MMFYKFDFSIDSPYAKGKFKYEKPFDESDLFTGKTKINEIGGKIILEKGKLGINIFSGWAFKIVDQDFRNFVEKYSLTGVDFQKIEIESNIKIDKNYYLMSIKGKCGSLFCKRETLTEKPSGLFPGKSEKGYQGLFFSLDSYDESDFFRPEGVNYIIIKESVKKKLEEEKFNLKYIEFDQLESFFMPEIFLGSGKILIL